MKTNLISNINFAKRLRPAAFIAVILLLVLSRTPAVTAQTNCAGKEQSFSNQVFVNPPVSAIPATVCVAKPADLVSWYQAEGNANDALGRNNPSATNAVSYAAGKVGQGFNFDGIDA
ncbi:MAG: hypothetical protein M3033_03660 [Acidobacteriota bacterium]|nr:hypothetical protein [Acidobacteriota bacterium]